MRKKGVNSFEDILGDHVLSVNILWKRGYFVEAASGVEFISIDLEKEDCSIVENIAVEDWAEPGGLGIQLGKTRG